MPNQDYSTSNGSDNCQQCSEASNSQQVREAGFTNFPNFLNSYGLKLGDDAAAAEGKAILRGIYHTSHGNNGGEADK
jgi:hypothetical protein